MTDFTYKFLGERRMLANFSQAQLPFNQQGDYLPLEEEWEINRAMSWRSPKDELLLSEKVLYIDKNFLETLWTIVWDRQGNYWKEQFAFRTSVKLHDGQPILSTGTIVITNVQNGRSTLVTIHDPIIKGISPHSLHLRCFRR
jgi:hypothetical protein